MKDNHPYETIMGDIETLWELNLTDKHNFAAMKIYLAAARYSRLRSNDSTETMLNIQLSVFDELGNIEKAQKKAFETKFHTYFTMILQHNIAFMRSTLEEMMQTFCSKQLELIDMLIRRILYYLERYNETKKVFIRKTFPLIHYIAITFLMIFFFFWIPD